MADVNIKLGQIDITNASDSATLVFVAANNTLEYQVQANSASGVASSVDLVQDNVTIVSANVYNTYSNLISYVDGEVANLVSGAPATLDTLSEIAAALENDANLAATLTTQIGVVSTNAATNSSNIDTVQSNLTALPNSAANDYATYSTVTANLHNTYNTLSAAIDTVQDNVDAIPDSAANDYATYTTLIADINTISDNVQSGDQTAAANDHATYTTLSGFINTVQDNVSALPDSAANDYSTYTTLSGLINTVQDNVSASDNNVWVNANDHATYTAVSNLVDTVQANLTSDIAVLDSFGSYANSTFALSNEAVTFTDLEVDNLTVDGDLVVRGNTTTLEATNTLFTDPLMLLNNGVAGANTVDTGIIFNRGTLANAAMMYDESEDVFHFGFTQQGGDATDLTYTALAPIRAGIIRGGNVEVGASSDGNHITAINGKTLKISGDESQATNIEIASNVIPTQNAVFSIGSPTAQLKDIYVSDGTIFIGTNSQISAESVSLTNFNVDSDGTIRIPGVNITADANAVETVQIVASDIASNAVIQTQINATVGFLTELNTSTQANVVDAINELIVDIGTVSDNAAAQTDATSDQFTISTQNTFTMSSSVSEANNIVVSVSGLLQMPSDDYVVSGTTLTLNNTTPLPQGASVEVRHIPTTGGGPAPTPSSILIDGNSASDQTYDNAVWTAGSDSAGIGFNEGVGLTWNSTNGRVTVASDGLYEIKWTAYLTGSGGENGHPQRWRLFKNGSQHVASFTNVYIDAAGGTDQSTTSIVLKLEADDYIQVKGASGTGFRPRIYGGSGHTYLQVTRVS